MRISSIGSWTKENSPENAEKAQKKAKKDGKGLEKPAPFRSANLLVADTAMLRGAQHEGDEKRFLSRFPSPK